MQTRAITGVDFEREIESEQWIRKEVKPKMIWEGEGNNVFDKIKNVNYDVHKFNLSDKSVFNKWDFVFHSDETLAFEVKRYRVRQFNKWLMYSEPFFKVSSKKNAEVVDVEIYNKFVNDFYTHRQDIINRVLSQIGNGSSGIRCLDGFITQDKLEYKVEVVKGWGGYNRITIFCKVKDEYKV
jgi:hypothetical protein